MVAAELIYSLWVCLRTLAIVGFGGAFGGGIVIGLVSAFKWVMAAFQG